MTGETAKPCSTSAAHIRTTAGSTGRQVKGSTMIRNLFGKPFPQSWPEGIRYTSPLKTFASQAKKVVTIGNIYFTASSDNGQTWNRNIRLNDVQPGVDGDPSLTIDEHGTLYALWRSCRESIFGDIYFAYS